MSPTSVWAPSGSCWLRLLMLWQKTRTSLSWYTTTNVFIILLMFLNVWGSISTMVSKMDSNNRYVQVRVQARAKICRKCHFCPLECSVKWSGHITWSLLRPPQQPVGGNNRKSVVVSTYPIKTSFSKTQSEHCSKITAEFEQANLKKENCTNVNVFGVKSLFKIANHQLLTSTSSNIYVATFNLVQI